MIPLRQVASKPGLECGFVEIEQQGATRVGQLEVREDLGGVNRQELIDALDLNDHVAVYNEIDPVSAIQALAFVDNRECNFQIERNFPLGELVAEALRYVDSRSPGPRWRCTSIAASMICPATGSSCTSVMGPR